MANAVMEEQAERHAGRIFVLAGRCFSKHSAEAARELERLYHQTWDYYRQGCIAYDGVMGIHAHALALWNVNGHSESGPASAQAHLAEGCYCRFLNSEAVSAMPATERQGYCAYLKNVRLICAYVDYCNDDLYGSRNWLQTIGFENMEAPEVALMAAVLFRLTMEEDRKDFLAPFHLFCKMDKMFTKPVAHLFEEKILCTAYGFYGLYYTHGICDPEKSVPYDPGLAVRILTRSCALFVSPRQKERMQEAIDGAKKMLSAQRG